jgi:hypothetical protein
MVSLQNLRSGGIAASTAPQPDPVVGAGPGLERWRIGDASIWEGEEYAMSEKRRWGRVVVSFELLADVLHLPDGAKILHVVTGDSKRSDGCCTLLVEDDDLRELGTEEIVPILNPEIATEHPVYSDGRVEPNACRVSSHWKQA